MSVHRLQTTGWINLSTLTSLDFTLNSIKLTNLSNGALYVTRSATIPADSFTGAEIFPKETYSFTKNALQTWIRAPFLGVIDADLLLDSSIEPFTSVDLPSDVWTETKEGFRRLRVDLGQTSFFLGKQFRSYYDFSLAAAEVRYFRFTSLTDFVLFDQSLSISGGSVRLSVWTGATPSGVWTSIPVIGKNRMTSIPQPPYVTNVTFQTGGTFTGGTEVEAIRLVAATATAQQSTVGANAGDERGLPATTFYIKVEATNSTPVVIYSLYWEERN